MMCAFTEPLSLSDAASPRLLRGSSPIVEESCVASNASTVSQEDARDARVADLPTWVNFSERKPQTATFGLAKSLWQPDTEALTCSLAACGKKFHRFLRRHHCRVCGRVVCADCSQGRRRLLPANGSGTGKALDARACDVCCHSADLYPMSRTITPSTPPRTGTMRPPTHAISTPPWGHALRLPVTSLSAPLAIPNSSPVWISCPDAAIEVRSDGRERAEDGAHADASVDEQDTALRDKFGKMFPYEGLLLHEPAALDVLLRCAVDELRSREMHAGASLNRHAAVARLLEM